MKDSVIIYSGGMDSTTMLYQFRDQIALAISFNYGSKHNEKEIECAKYHCDLLGIQHIIIELGFIAEHFNSSLLKTGGEIPEGHYADENMKSTVVPFRNGIMLAIAAGIAENIGARFVFIANHSGDHAIYPDCRKDFINAMGRAMEFGTYKHISIVAPYTTLTKREIAERGFRHGIDYAKTWSCYKGGDIHCGKCGTCVERKEALEGFDTTCYEDQCCLNEL